MLFINVNYIQNFVDRNAGAQKTHCNIRAPRGDSTLVIFKNVSENRWVLLVSPKKLFAISKKLFAISTK